MLPIMHAATFYIDWKRQRTTSSGSGDDYDENLSLLQGELVKEKPKSKKVRKLMKTTFGGRRLWILTDRPAVAEVLNVFPTLKKMKYVS